MQEVNPTPTVLVFAFAFAVTATTSSKDAICSALAPATCQTKNNPPIPRRLCAWSFGADNTSSFKTTV